MSHKFKIGDRVINSLNKVEGHILTYAPDIKGIRQYMVSYTDPWFPTETVGEPYLSLVEDPKLPIKTGARKCECGAWATTFPDCHSYWCPEYK